MEQKNYHKNDKEGVAFVSAEEAWFWFMAANQARLDGARPAAGLADIPRPCEPSDILQILTRLYRQRLVVWDHVKILHHYGQRFLPPDPARPKEMRAAKLWREGLARLESRMIPRGIVIPMPWLHTATARGV